MNKENQELSFQLLLHLAEKENNTSIIQRELDHENRKAWPLTTMKIAIKILANGTPPLAVSRNLESTCRLTCNNVIIRELPNIDYIHTMRGVIKIMMETHAMYLLGKNPQQKQLQCNSASRYTVSMTTFAAGMLKNNEIKLIIIQTSKIGLGEKSKDTIEQLQEALEHRKEYLEELIKICEREFSNYAHDIPSPSSISITNYSTYTLTNDAYNQATFSRKLIDIEIKNAGVREDSEEGNIYFNYLLQN